MGVNFFIFRKIQITGKYAYNIYICSYTRRDKFAIVGSGRLFIVINVGNGDVSSFESLIKYLENTPEYPANNDGRGKATIPFDMH